MRCDACGEENREGASFCTRCGNSLKDTVKETAGEAVRGAVEETEEKAVGAEVQKQQEIAGKKRRKWLYACAAIIVAAACAAGGYFYKAEREEKAYEEQLQNAKLFLEDNDYEGAKDSYDQGTDEDEKTDERQNEEENIVSYTWHLEPSVEADNIDYVTDADYNERSLNELCTQYSSPYAVIQRGDLLGLIDMDGNLKEDVRYESIVNYVGDYCLVEKGAEDGEGTYVMSSDNDDLINILDLGYGYVIYNWYYSDGLHEPHEFDETFRMDDPPLVGIPIRNSRELINEEGGNWEEQLEDSRYAIWVWNKLTTDFIYDKCGSSSCGLMAVCRDGKWGYVNEWGETVIPLEYDASWKYYSNPYELLELEVEYGGKVLPEQMQEYCYGAAEGYIPLCKAGVWEMRDTDGKIAIPAGEFEEIRPPYRGKCWVKKNGKWGVIELQEKDFSEEKM